MNDDSDGLRVRARTFPNGAVNDDPTWDVGAGLPVTLVGRRTQSGVTTTTRFVYGLGLISTTDNAGAASYYLADGLGSTTQLVDGSGSVTDTYTYDVFGALRSSSGSTSNPFDFAGQQTDHNANRGLQYLRARHYDPALGRFLGRDPVPFAQRYAYAFSDPVNRTDPSGRDASESHRPVAIPLPIPLSTDHQHRCQTAWDYCRRVTARQFLAKRGGKIGMYRAVCYDFYMRCMKHANALDPDTYFDYDGVRETMRNLSTSSPGSIFDILDGLGLPPTGSGGFSTPTPNGASSGFGCLQ